MNLLSVENITKTYAEKTLFESVSFGISKGQKIALIAKNGTGKTTLLNCLVGKDKPDEGNIAFRKDTIVGYLQQEQSFNPELSILDAVFDSSNTTLSLLKEYEICLNDPSKEERLQELSERISILEAWDTENKVREILSKLRLDDVNQKVGSLSGGQLRRLALTKVLIEEPDLMILDEPTNHLDLEMIEWLEEYINRSKITLLMVTHDRYFLERLCDEILELDEGNLYRYKGSYSYYLNKREERHQNLQTNIDKAKNLFKKELEWMRKQPKARGTKAKSRVDSFFETKKAASQKIDERQMNIEIKMERMGAKILELHKVSKSFGEKKILDQFSYIFKRQEKIGLAGVNGSGKSTLLNLITDELQPDQGKIVKGETIVFGYYNQNGLQLKEDKRVIEVIRDIGEYLPLGKGKKLSAIQLLERFLFPSNMHYQYVSTLSGGQRKRLYLLTILMKNPNFLILDEPTNDLDIFTLQVLEDYLQDFQGCVIIVSHDRYFMDKIVDHLFYLNGDGTVSDFIGNYSNFKSQRKKEGSSSKNSDTKVVSLKKEEVAKQKTKLSFNEKHEFEQLDEEIPNLESRKKELSEKLNDATLPFNEIESISGELNKLVVSLEKKSERWLELSEFV